MMQIKLSDYVANFLVKEGVQTVFAVSGGASLHLIHSVAANRNLTYVCPHHEQAAAMAADGYARTINGLGVAIATSGPGATNLITGMCCSYYDSVPVLFLTGQVSTFRMVGDTGVRQIGFQETPIIDICRPITKYVVSISDPLRIRFELEKAIFIAKSGRPGPVLVDIPDNFQRMMIDESLLAGFDEKDIGHEEGLCLSQVKNELMGLLRLAKRPVLIAGWGVHLSGTEKEVIRWAETLNIPVALTWGGADLLPKDHPLYIGTFGTHGMRHANFAVQNSDLVIALGTKLDTKSTGTPVDSFARDAKKVIVDIDTAELEKFSTFNLKVDLPIKADLNEFFSIFTENELVALSKDTEQWLRKIDEWRIVGEDIDSHKRVAQVGVEPYRFMSNLSRALSSNSRLFIDTGCSIAWAMQAMEFKSGQRVFHDFNNTAMGWALPASIGSYFAIQDGQIVCVVGDGSFMMTMHELATVMHHQIPIKIFLINNSGYSMIKQTQEQWLDSNYFASSGEGGLSFPDYIHLAQAFDIEYRELKSDVGMSEKLQEIVGMKNSVFCNVVVDTAARVVPQVKFGRPNEDMEPLLPREVFRRMMITSPLPESNQ